MTGHPSSLPRSGTRILVGATPDDLAGLDGAARIVLVQPEATIADALARATQDRAEVSLHQVMPGNSSGAATLHVMNLGSMNSLRKPLPALATLLPGLRETRSQPVNRVAVADLLQQIGDLPPPISLGVVASGDEAEVIAGFAAAGVLEGLAEVTLRCSALAVFEDAPSCDQLQERLQEAGFRLAARDVSDPDWPILTFRPDPVARDLKAAEARLAVLQAELAQASARSEEAGKAAEAQAVRLKEVTEKADWRFNRIQELEAALDKSDHEQETLRQRLATVETAAAAQAAALKTATEKADWRHGRIQELEAALAAAGQEQEALRQSAAASATAAEDARTAAAAQAAALKTATEKADWRHGRIQELEAALSAAGQAQETLRQSVAALETAAEEARTAAAAQQVALKSVTEKADWRFGRIQELETAHDRSVKELETLRRQLAEQEQRVKADLAVSLRLQTLARQDLQGLQEKHAALIDEKDRMDDLLRKLTARLAKAADYLNAQDAIPAALPTATALVTVDKKKSKSKKAGKKARGRKSD